MLVQSALRHRMPLIAGVSTPSEALRMMELGFKVCKLFPAKCKHKHQKFEGG